MGSLLKKKVILLSDKSKNKLSLSHIFLHVFLIVSAGIIIIPFVWMISTSLKPLQDVFTLNIEWIPEIFVWENYIRAWTELPFLRYLLNSVIVSVVVTLGTLIFSSMAGYAFGRLNFPVRDQLFLLYLDSMMIPVEITVVPNFILMSFLEWTDTYQGIIAPQMFNIFGTFLMRQFFMSLPKELEDSAKIDGCSHFKIYYKIALPLSKPALAALGIFAFMGSWNNFLWPLIITKSDNLNTIPVSILSYQGQFTTDWPVLMATAGSAVVPVIIVYLVFQKYFIEG